MFRGKMRGRPPAPQTGCFFVSRRARREASPLPTLPHQRGGLLGLRTVIHTIKLSATETFQWSPKSEIAAIKLWRYDSPQHARQHLFRSRPRQGGIGNGRHLSACKVGRFGGCRARRPRGGKRVARAPWQAAVAGATSDRISEILPRGGPRWALGRGTWRHDRWLRLQLDDGEVLVFV